MHALGEEPAVVRADDPGADRRGGVLAEVAEPEVGRLLGGPAHAGEDTPLLRPLDAGGDPAAPGQPALLRGRSAAGGVPTAYVCRAFTCELPTADPGVVEQQVKSLVGDTRPGV